MGSRILNRHQEIERSLSTKYRKDIYSKILKAVKDYELISDNDKIMVCISGGKDSFLLAKCVQQLQLYGKTKFEARYVVMNPGYSDYNLKNTIKNAEILNVPIEIFNTDIFEIVNNIDSKSPCYLCARMRRGHLYNKALEIGCNKIALGHHFDDVIETTLLSMFYGAEVKTMMPKLHSDNFEGVDLIRPICLVKEKNIISWANYNKLNFINCACCFTENNFNNDEGTSKRKEIKEIIQNLKKNNKEIDNNIYKAMENVNLNCIIGWHKKDEKGTFLDDF